MGCSMEDICVPTMANRFWAEGTVVASTPMLQANTRQNTAATARGRRNRITRGLFFCAAA